MMRCDYCNKMTPMPALRFIEDGKVPGVINVPRHRAQCADCSRSAKNTIDGKPNVEVATDAAPF